MLQMSGGDPLGPFLCYHHPRAQCILQHCYLKLKAKICRHPYLWLAFLENKFLKSIAIDYQHTFLGQLS